LADFITERLNEVAPATVDRDLDVIAQVTNYADNVWKIAASESPFKGLPRPKYFNERDRRLKGKEESLLLEAARADENPYIEPAITIALQTAMRRGEILSLRLKNIDWDERAALLPETKNGRSRKVPLSQVALDILRALPKTDDGRIFPITANALKLAWSRRVLPRANIDDLHFHDLRHEATSRLAESGQYTLLDLQAITGHRDVRMLQRYSHLCTRKLGEKMDTALPKPAQTYIWRGRKRVAGTLKAEKENENLMEPTSQIEQQPTKMAGNIIVFPSRKLQSLG
jgi:integrase